MPPVTFWNFFTANKINHSLLLLLNETKGHFYTASNKTPDKRIPIDTHQTNWYILPS